MMERFTDHARKVMQLANQEAQRFNHEYIGTEHILLGLVKEGSGVAANVLKNLDIDLRKIRQEIEKIVQPGAATAKTGKMPQTPRAKKVIEYSIEEARKLQHNYVGTEHLLLGLLREEEGLAAQVLMNLGLELDKVREEVLKVLGAGSGSEPTLRLATRTLDAYGCDLTERARKDQLDPFVGRDDELERVRLILARRTRNNPLLVGEPGVGKTALVHALARRMVVEDAARWAPFRRVVEVDVAWCATAADNYDIFRKRIESIVDEVRMAKDVLLFLDGLHGWEENPYALSPLTAALNRGAVQCVAVMTSPCNPPCFEPVRVEPLSRSATLPVLVALRDRYARHHRVTIADAAIQAAAELGESSAGGRRLPGAAVDVLDEACARVRLRAGPVPAAAELAELDARITELNQGKEAAVLVQNFEKAARFFAEIDALKREREAREREITLGVVDAAAVAEVVRLRRGSAL